MPYDDWLINAGSQGAAEADKAAAVTVLHGLHEDFLTTNQPIKLIMEAKQVRAVAKSAVAVAGICLPPCVPKGAKVYDASDHPLAVCMKEKVMLSPEETCKAGVKDIAAVAGTKNDKEAPKAGKNDKVAAKAGKHDKTAAPEEVRKVMRQKTYFMLPEFSYPRHKEVEAGAKKNTDAEGSSEVKVEWLWHEGGPCTMHPFWAVRRMTQKQLAVAAVNTPLGKRKPRFNCMLENRTVTGVCNFAVIT